MNLVQFLGKGHEAMIQLKEAADAIDAARRNVEKAQLAFQKGASADVIVKADRKLVDAHARFHEIAGGLVHDDR
jgi:hypothetical protein